jgi:hypothetical protein
MSSAVIPTKVFAQLIAVDLESEVDEGIEIVRRKKCQY